MKIVRFSNLRESGVTTKVAASRATVLNTGTPDAAKFDACLAAGKAAQALGHPVAIVDINDLGANILGFSEKEPSMDQIAKILGDNPLGQSSESTPMGIIRKA